MTGGAGHIQYRPLHAPREDRTCAVEPPLDQVDALVAANQELRKRYAYDFGGHSLPALAGQGREELVAEARRYTSAYRDVDVPPFEPGRNVFLAGHQPQLFHPGVWFKNFAMGAPAQQHAAVAVNLVIDSDAMKTAAVRVPGGSVARPRATLLPMDALGPMVPFEERRILDSDTFAGFGRRAAEEIASLVREPLVRQYWSRVRERARRQPIWENAWPSRDTNWKDNGGSRRWSCRKATSAGCPRSPGSRHACWPIYHDSRPPTTRRSTNTGKSTIFAVRGTPFRIWPRRTVGWRRRFGFGRRTIRAAAGSSSDTITKNWR